VGGSRSAGLMAAGLPRKLRLVALEIGTGGRLLFCCNTVLAAETAILKKHSDYLQLITTLARNRTFKKPVAFMSTKITQLLFETKFLLKIGFQFNKFYKYYAKLQKKKKPTNHK
jgi:hypothetical protein